MTDPLNILATLDQNYVPYFNVMLSSLLFANPGEEFAVYLLHDSLTPADLAESRRILGDRGRLFPVRVEESQLEGAPTTDRYPKKIYYRISLIHDYY